MKTYKLVGIGNAIVDVIAHTSDEFLSEKGIEKGIMQLVEQDRAEDLYDAMRNRTQAAGGSVANTLAGVGALGLKTAFIGRVNDDDLGRFYAKTSQDEGCDFVNPPISGGELPTSRSMIFVSPDGERSMNTYLGISAELGPDDVDEAIGADAEIVYLEGYLFDKDKGKDAFVKLARACRAAGGKAGIAISDPFCVERHRDDFLNLIENELDYVIGNDAEILALFEEENLDVALSKTANICPLVICTRGEQGVSIIQDGTRFDVGVTPIKVVDATGAGDQFAAGFLYGLIQGHSIETCARMGGISAGEVISHVGPRPQTDIMELFKQNGLM